MILDCVFVCIHLILPTPWNSIIEDMPCFLVYAAGTVVLNTKLVIIIHSHLLLFAPLISEEFPYQFPWGCFQIKEKLATTPHRIPQSQIKCGAARLFVKPYQIHRSFWNSPNSNINVNNPMYIEDFLKAQFAGLCSFKKWK